MPNNFTYTNNIPNPNNNPSVDVTPMQVNNNSINSLISVDHVGFNTNGSGIHKQVTLPIVSPPGLGDGSGVLFGSNLNIADPCWPFWKNASGIVQLFNGIPSASANGYVYLPGGIIIQWGKNTPSVPPGTTAVTVTVSFPIPFPNACFTAMVCPIPNNSSQSSSNNTWSIVSVATNQFQWRFAGSSFSNFPSVYWLAIGN